MSLANGQSYLAIPGPSVMPDAVLRAMHRASPNIYEGELVDMMPELVDGLKRVARTEYNVAIYIGNGHAAWEASLSNVLDPGDLVLVPCTGRFCVGWGEMATGLGAEVEMMGFLPHHPMDLAKIEERLRADPEHRIKAILAVHVDTSTSIRNDIAGLRRALDAVGHPALLMVDCIASLACDRFDMDAWGVDVMVAASQKGLMVPPGMCFVYFNGRAAEARANIQRVSRYWDWVPRSQPEMFFQYFGGTAPTHHLYGLQVALDMLKTEGMELVWARHRRLARAIWAACEAWGTHGPLTLHAPDPAFRSHAVTALRLGAPHGTRLRKWMQENTGVTLGIGLGMSEPNDPNGDGFFRIGHMGHVNAHMVLGVLASMQAAFDALDIPYGPGALDAATKALQRKG